MIARRTLIVRDKVDNNFDWLVGRWVSRQRRLRNVLAGGDEWYDFDGIRRGSAGAASSASDKGPSSGRDQRRPDPSSDRAEG